MHEYILNIHMHTKYSDGSGLHAEIVQAALHAGIDAVIVTDHNVLVHGPEGYYRDGNRAVLMMIGQEVHDQARQPQKNHLLALGANRDVAPLAHDPQQLINAINQADGLSFIAHPSDPAAPAINQDDLSWVSWGIENFTGLEVWNGLSEIKARVKSKFHGLYFLYRPTQAIEGPFRDVLRKWDDLLIQGKRVVGIGGSDAHALQIRLGPFHWTAYPYKFHFKTINTHILTKQELSGNAEADRLVIIEALRNGTAFIGYDLPFPSRGFRFTAQGKQSTVWMGNSIEIDEGITLQVRLPLAAECHLIKDGEIVKIWQKRETCTYITNEPGVYRVEVYIPFQRKLRGWIFSNPIYLRTS